MYSYNGGLKSKYLKSNIYRDTFIIDVMSIFAAFFSAVIIRYHAIIDWVDYSFGIYVSMIITVFLFEVIVFFVYDTKRPTIVMNDPFDNLIKLIKSRMLLILLSVTYLFATQKSVLASRKVMIYFMALSVVYGYLLRMVYIKQYFKRFGTDGKENVLVLKAPFQKDEELISKYEKGNYEYAVVERLGTSQSETDRVLNCLVENGIRTYISLNSDDYVVRPGIVTDIAGYAAIPASIRKDRFELFGVGYSVARIEEAVHHVIRNLEGLKGKYICFSNVHTLVMARDDKDYADVLNGSAIIFPDGAPIAAAQKRRGYIGAERVAGPDFMRNMFRDTQNGLVSHFFYGSTNETLEALKKNLLEEYPGINIKGMYSPPFRALSSEEDAEIVKMINESNADILWVGLGAPKQEKWMKDHEGKINAVMMGVGAGFDFHAGTMKRAPLWVQKLSLEWLYRLFSDPKRLFKRYFVTNFKYFWYILCDRLNKKNS